MSIKLTKWPDDRPHAARTEGSLVMSTAIEPSESESQKRRPAAMPMILPLPREEELPTRLPVPQPDQPPLHGQAEEEDDEFNEEDFDDDFDDDFEEDLDDDLKEFEEELERTPQTDADEDDVNEPFGEEDDF